MAVKYTSSVNAVHYFSVLPFGLNDAAVNKAYLGLVKIKDQAYHKIEVTFNEKGGGEDFEDVLKASKALEQLVGELNFPWCLTPSYNLEYFTDEGGIRFREAYNERFVNGIRFIDYNNYKPKDDEVQLVNLDNLFQKNELELLSVVELKNISVN